MFGALLLAACVFGPWYAAVSPLAEIAGSAGIGDKSAWQVHHILRWVFLVIAIAPFVLAYVIARDHQLSWARGELTAVLSILVVGLVLYVGVIDRPGEPPGQIELRWGWYVALAGSLLMLTGAALRSGESAGARKPPGMI